MSKQHQLLRTILLSYFLFCLTFAAGRNQFTPQPHLPYPDFLIAKASPLSAADSASFAQLADNNTLSTHLHSFCKKANLFCFPDFTPNFEKHSFDVDKINKKNYIPRTNDKNFGSYADNDKNFGSYADGSDVDKLSKKNYIPRTNDKNFGSYADNDKNFGSYADGSDVDKLSKKNYIPRTNDKNFGSYADNDKNFGSYADGSDVDKLSKKNYIPRTNDKNFGSYADNDKNFGSYADGSDVDKLSKKNYIPRTNDKNFGSYADNDKNFGSYADGSDVDKLSKKNYIPRTNDKNFGSYADNDKNFGSYADGSDVDKLSKKNYIPRTNDKNIGRYADGSDVDKLSKKNYIPRTNDKNFGSYADGSDVAKMSKKNYTPRTNDKNFGRYIDGRNDIVETSKVDGIFFREEKLKTGTVMQMPDIKDKLPERSFLSRSLLSKLPFSSSKISEMKQIFNAFGNSSMETILNAASQECERAPSPGETKRCVGSPDDMIDFAISVLGNSVQLRTTESTNGSKNQITIGKVRGINGGKVTHSVSCHQSLYPYLLYYCHSVPKVRVYEADILDPNTNIKINHGVAICHLDTSAWGASHVAFSELGSGPGKIEVCHWIYENDLAWTISD